MVTVRTCVFLLFIAAVVGKSLKNRRPKFLASKPNWYQSLRQAGDVMVGGNGNTSYLTSSPRRIRRQAAPDYPLLKSLIECSPPNRIYRTTLNQCEEESYTCAGRTEKKCSSSSYCKHACQPQFVLISLPNRSGCVRNTVECKCGSKPKTRNPCKRTGWKLIRT